MLIAFLYKKGMWVLLNKEMAEQLGRVRRMGKNGAGGEAMEAMRGKAMAEMLGLVRR